MIRRKRRHWPRIEQQQITDGVKKGSEKVLGSVWRRILRIVLRRGLALGFTVKKGSEKASQKGF